MSSLHRSASCTFCGRSRGCTRRSCRQKHSHAAPHGVFVRRENWALSRVVHCKKTHLGFGIWQTPNSPWRMKEGRTQTGGAEQSHSCRFWHGHGSEGRRLSLVALLKHSLSVCGASVCMPTRASAQKETWLALEVPGTQALPCCFRPIRLPTWTDLLGGVRRGGRQPA